MASSDAAPGLQRIAVRASENNFAVQKPRGLWDPADFSADADSEKAQRRWQAKLTHGKIVLFSVQRMMAEPSNTSRAGIATAIAFTAASLPTAAGAIELTYEGFGGPELAAIFLPWFFLVPGYAEWLKQQPFKDDEITGYGTLGKTVDAPGDAGYFRRSPENG
jgi:hypothetical protein